MATLSLSISTNYSGALLFNVTDLDFTNLVPRSLATATFGAAQFDNAKIKDALALDGSTGRNAIVVNGGAVDASGWTFTNWSANDSVTLSGSISGETIVGSSHGDTINGNGGDDDITGGAGRDRLFGGDGNDTIRLLGENEWVAGESIDGGSGALDVLVVAGDANTDYVFIGAAIAGVEKLQFIGGVRADFSAAQIGGTGITQVEGDASGNLFSVRGSAIDLTGIAFTGFEDSFDYIFLYAEDDIAANFTGGGNAEWLYGETQADTLNGGGGHDRLFGREGADIMSGGNGADTFSYIDSDDTVEGETLDGGAGTDTISISRGGTHEWWKLSLVSIERASFGNFAGQAELAGSQIGAAAGLINEVKGGWSPDSLVVLGPVADLTDVVFTNWSVLDKVTLKGQADAQNTLTATAFADTVIGGDLNDTLNGGKGVDTIIGGLGKDIITGGNQGDYYVFLSSADSGIGADRDLIKDFSVGNDIIDLSAIDAIPGGSDDAFTFLGLAAAFTGAGQVRYEISDGGNTTIRINLDDDLQAEMEIGLTGTNLLTLDEFIL